VPRAIAAGSTQKRTRETTPAEARSYGRGGCADPGGVGNTSPIPPGSSNAAPNSRGRAGGARRTSTSHRPEPIAITATNTRIVAPDGFGAGKLRRPPRPTSHGVICLGWRMKILPLQRSNSPINATFTRARNTRQRIQGGGAECLTIRRQERTSEAGNQRLGIEVRCCHGTALRER